MRKSYALLWCSVMILGLLAAGCKKKVAPVSERIAKAWTAESVKHGATVVYTRGGSGNIEAAYSGFRLTLTNTGGTKTVSLTDVDGKTFTGNWDLEGDTKLVLTNLTPQPTGSGGKLEFTISGLEDSRVVLTRLTASPKTGNTINEYTLSNP
ncbi:hypothetical protein J2Y45_004943 [Dyadobacter sp. BE34]|uniref:Lipocalin-like domain-containing protein n=1 Tax=Dyadobacter fermentans TaxID=94254 RepID=A0ABU1R316_9BACT|nr:MULTISPECIES: hypothetical protein [Dyadobacter]MDR6807743.1 hypothetical protein [Dyadobacter fermentans]MDR7045484.1 hypothetical protein [Dyadobacter sp. BE242]MDR7199797.1 hypothetical protein [Dyadobacter sp. BE34]MDR7217744.1 hypothetical protein [Dyadobacter sp. BE31]MDR7265688.1 hypothetical protein [Dyadobacter sp. BE32]